MSDTLPNCRHRIKSLGGGRYACDSTKLIITKLGVTAEVCNRCPYIDHEPEPNAIQTPPRWVALGDHIEKALDVIGMTKERASKWLGTRKCSQRQEALNQLGAWAHRVTSGKIEQAREYLERILGS